MNYKSELINDILPFWLGDAIDRVNGGIFTCLDREGKIYGREKSVWFQGRALWVFSKAYNLIEKRKEYLDAAKTIYSFLPKCTDSDGRMFFKVTEDGRCIQKRRYYYSETFAAIGCAELYKATLDEKILADAEKYFDVAYECFTGERKNEPKFSPETSDGRALAPIMIMLSTAQVMRSAAGKNSQKYDNIAKKCVDDILNGGFLTDKALMESVGKNGEFLDTPSGRVVNPGHSLEAAWFLLSEGLLSGNNAAIDGAKKIIDLTLPLGLDRSHGAVIAFTDVLGKPPMALEWDMKLWWPQCEAIIALRLAHGVFGDEKYEKAYKELEEYCEKYFIDREYGEWYGYLHYDNTPSTTLKGNIFKGPFHIPRFYMIMASMDDSGNILEYMK